jgi:DNA-binding NarL/FixJ family response regulator
MIIRVLVVEDSLLLRKLIVNELAGQKDIEIVGEAENGWQALAMARKLYPDVVTMDYQMEGMNGVVATQKLLVEMPYLKVIWLSSYTNLTSIGKSLGAAECLHKDCDPEELLHAVRRAHASRVGVKISEAQNPHQAAIERIAKQARLTEREKRVIAKYMDTNLTISQIARILTEETEELVTPSGVKHTFERAAGKLDLDSNTRMSLIRYVMDFEALNDHAATIAPIANAERFSPLSHSGLFQGSYAQ